MAVTCQEYSFSFFASCEPLIKAVYTLVNGVFSVSFFIRFLNIQNDPWSYLVKVSQDNFTSQL